MFLRSVDGYATSEVDRVIHIPDAGADGALVIKNRAEHNRASSGYKLRFKQLDVLSVTYDEHTIDYTYDALSRLLEADYDSGAQVFTYGYDVAGNLTNMNGAARTYNAANQLVNDGVNTLTYDNNGNLTSDGVNTCIWDRANRLKQVDIGADTYKYGYDGSGHRIAQDVNSVVTQYLNDVQPGLVKVLAATTGVNTERYVHGVRGIHAQEDSAGVWTWMTQDGLGSVRGQVSPTLMMLGNQELDPYGNRVTRNGTIDTAFEFTGEWKDGTELLNLRARYYAPQLGVFPSLDPFEGMMQRPMSLNGYSWVEGRVPNAADPTGMFAGVT